MKYLSLLKKLAAKSDHKYHQMSCIVVKKNRVISTGYNQLKTCPNSPHKYKFIHCEYMALKGLSVNDTKGCTVYIYRENKLGVLSNSKPCESCNFMLQKAGLERMIFSNDGGWREEYIQC